MVILQALRSLGSVVYGLGSILLLGPLVVAPFILSLPLHPPAVGMGLAVFASMPTSLSSGIAMTQVGRGPFVVASQKGDENTQLADHRRECGNGHPIDRLLQYIGGVFSSTGEGLHQMINC